MTHIADRLGLATELSELLAQARPQTAWTRAGLALVGGDYAQAADEFNEIGDLEREAHARVRASRKLLSEGRRSEADEQLAKALGFFRKAGATRYIREAEALLTAPVERRA